MGVCPPTPLPNCKLGQLGKGSFRLSQKIGNTAKNRFVWAWNKGAATSLAELGDPLNTTTFSACVYDGSGSLLTQLAIAPGGVCVDKPCWKAVGRPATPGFRYANKLTNGDGVTRFIIKAGIDGKARIRLVAKAGSLLMPTLPLVQTPNPVVVMLVNSANSSCWEASYSDPPKSKPGTAKWRDVND